MGWMRDEQNRWENVQLDAGTVSKCEKCAVCANVSMQYGSMGVGEYAVWENMSMGVWECMGGTKELQGAAAIQWRCTGDASHCLWMQFKCWGWCEMLTNLRRMKRHRDHSCFFSHLWQSQLQGRQPGLEFVAPWEFWWLLKIIKKNVFSSCFKISQYFVKFSSTCIWCVIAKKWHFYDNCRLVWSLRGLNSN